MKAIVTAALAAAAVMLVSGGSVASATASPGLRGAAVGVQQDFSARRYRHHRKTRHARPARTVEAVPAAIAYNNDGRMVMSGPAHNVSRETFRQTANYEDGYIVGGRPAGCPHRYCACALSLKLFGRIIPALNLAANWPLRFAHAAPASGMVAARSGHAFQLLSPVGGNVWRVYDANSGGGKTRIHNRSIAGYRIVDPSRPLMASR